MNTQASASKPHFMIGPVPIYGDLILAPMAGFSDQPFRTICREMGSAISYTACAADEAISHAPEAAYPITAYLEQERPVAIQILTCSVDTLLEAGRRLADRPAPPDFLDINMGCPAKRVTKGGRGSGLLRNPLLASAMVATLTRELPLPITAKIRLGWDADTRNYREMAHILEESGVAALAVHGRTRSQAYSGQADWDAIAEIKQMVSVPVIANGDVRTTDDIQAIKQLTGCDAIMIGRAAIGNPWIFARRDIADVPYEERLPVIKRHLAAMLAFYDPHRGLLAFRKHIVRYTQRLEHAREMRPRLVSCEDPNQLLEDLEGWQTAVVS